MADDLSLSTEQHGGRSIVVADGELDESTSGMLVEAVKLLLDDGRDVLVDMAEVTFMSSAGIAALVQLHTHAGTTDCVFGVRNPSAIVRRVIEIVRLEETLLREP